MAQTIKLKRSSTGGAVPSTSSLSLGEVAINTYDGKMYIKKNDGSDAIVEIGAGTSAVWKSYDYTATSSQTSFSGNDNNSESLSYVAGFVQVFLNGILLDPAVDYTATTGSSIVLNSGASTGDLLQIESFTQIIGTGDILVDTFPVSSTQTAFTLSQDPVNKSNISVYVEGVYQESSTYSLSTTTLTLSESPANGTTVEVVIGTRNVTLDNIADLTISGTLHAGALDLGDANIINVNEISLDTIKGDADANTNITFAGSDVTTFTQGGTERLRLNTTGAEVTGNIVVSGTVDGRDVAADGVTADAALSRAGGAMGGAITTNSTFDGRDVSVDGTKLDGIESGATADQTDVEIRAAVESASDSNVFTNADHSKLDGIEALADVTDATNVTAAGALMDSEVTNLAQVKAFDSSDYATAAQGTTANAALPKAGGTLTGTLNGGAANFSNAVKIGGWLTGASNTNTLFSHTFLGTIIQTPSNTDNAAGSFFIKDSAGVTHFTLNTNTDVSTFTGTISSGAISATGSANSGSASHLPAFLASGNYGGGIATRDTKESGWYQQTNGADWHFYHNRTVASDTPTSKIVLSFNSSGNATFAGTLSSGAITSTGLLTSVGGVINTNTGSNALYITRLGNTNESLKIHCDDRGAVFESIQDETADTYGNFIFAMDAGVTEPYFDVRKGSADSASIFRVDGGGNVGIGTTAPGAKLHILQTAETFNDGIKIVGSSGPISGRIYMNGEHLHIDNATAGANTGLTLDDNGNVGIGTASPNNKLTVTGGSDGINIQGTSSYLRWNSGDMMIRNEGSYAMGFHTYDGSSAQVERMRITSAGNVGIGTDTPAYKLDINGDPRIRGTQGRLYFDTLNAGASNWIGSYNDYELVIANGRGNAGHLIAGNSDIRFGFGTAFTSAQALMVIKPTGRVGIGVTAPSSLLDVRGSLGANGTAATPTAYFINSQSGATSGSIYIGASSGIDWKIGKNVTGISGNVNFSIADSSGNRRFDIDASGNVGIGTASPFSRLQSGSHTFSGGHGMYTNGRVGMSNHGNLTGMMLASTYNDAAHPEYGLVFVQGPSTSSYNVWSVSPDGPAKGDSLNFHYQAQSTNIHAPANAKVSFDGNGNIAFGGSLHFKTAQNGSFIGSLNTSDLRLAADGNHIFQTYLGGWGTRMEIRDNGIRFPAGDYGVHTTQEHYTASTPASSFSTASNITYNSSTQYWPDQGEKQICVINARAFTKYIHIKTNLTANNIMFYFRTKGYFYSYGIEEQLIGGYTYYSGGNIIISKSNETVAGNTHTGDTYRASDGSLVLKMHVNQTGYTEGKMLVFFHAHAPSTTSAITVTAVTQKDDGTNAF